MAAWGEPRHRAQHVLWSPKSRISFSSSCVAAGLFAGTRTTALGPTGYSPAEHLLFTVNRARPGHPRTRRSPLFRMICASAWNRSPPVSSATLSQLLAHQRRSRRAGHQGRMKIGSFTTMYAGGPGRRTDFPHDDADSNPGGPCDMTSATNGPPNAGCCENFHADCADLLRERESCGPAASVSGREARTRNRGVSDDPAVRLVLKDEEESSMTMFGSGRQISADRNHLRAAHAAISEVIPGGVLRSCGRQIHSIPGQRTDHTGCGNRRNRFSGKLRFFFAELLHVFRVPLSCGVPWDSTHDVYSVARQSSRLESVWALGPSRGRWVWMFVRPRLWHWPAVGLASACRPRERSRFRQIFCFETAQRAVDPGWRFVSWARRYWPLRTGQASVPN